MRQRFPLRSAARPRVFGAVVVVALWPFASYKETTSRAAGSSGAWDRPGWRLVWYDEFDAAMGPDWVYEIDTGVGGWGNNEFKYTGPSENACVEGGALLIEVRRERYQGSDYTSARLKAEKQASFNYARIEARMQQPPGQGMWPAFCSPDSAHFLHRCFLQHRHRAPASAGRGSRGTTPGCVFDRSGLPGPPGPLPFGLVRGFSHDA
jgi:hypothetical protein